MPFKNAEDKAAYMKAYWERYLARKEKGAAGMTKLKTVRKRQAKWFKANQPRLTAKQRLNRRRAKRREVAAVVAEVLKAAA